MQGLERKRTGVRLVGSLRLNRIGIVYVIILVDLDMLFHHFSQGQRGKNVIVGPNSSKDGVGTNRKITQSYGHTRIRCEPSKSPGTPSETNSSRASTGTQRSYMYIFLHARAGVIQLGNHQIADQSNN